MKKEKGNKPALDTNLKKEQKKLKINYKIIINKKQKNIRKKL